MLATEVSVYPTMSNIVNSNSTKEQIIQSSMELVGDLDNKVEIEKKLSLLRNEERDSVIIY